MKNGENCITMGSQQLSQWSDQARSASNSGSLLGGLSEKLIFDRVPCIKLCWYIIVSISKGYFHQYTGIGRVDDGGIRGDRKLHA